MLGPNSFNTPENNDSNSIFIQLKMLDFTYYKYVYLCVSVCVCQRVMRTMEVRRQLFGLVFFFLDLCKSFHWLTHLDDLSFTLYLEIVSLRLWSDLDLNPQFRLPELPPILSQQLLQLLYHQNCQNRTFQSCLGSVTIKKY